MPDYRALSIETRLNGELVQQERLDDLLFGVAEVVAYLSQISPLEAGDVIALGTPFGAGINQQPSQWLSPRDEVSVSVAGIGTLRTAWSTKPTPPPEQNSPGLVPEARSSATVEGSAMNGTTTMTRPEVGKTVFAKGLRTNYLEKGSGDPIVLIHGSGPGVSAWANWRLVIDKVAEHARVIAVDMAGFGFTELEPGAVYNMDYWLEHLTSFLDALGLRRVSFLGNSFGGTLATHFALRHPERVDRIAMMGANLLSFPITPALDKLWGEAATTHEQMAEHMRFFPYDRSIITDDLVASRLTACARPDYDAAFRSMFPAPRQNKVDEMALTEAQLASLECEALLIHGREDVVVPVDVSIRAQAAIPRSQLHVFGECGHWVMIEHNRAFVDLVRSFFAPR